MRLKLSIGDVSTSKLTAPEMSRSPSLCNSLAEIMSLTSSILFPIVSLFPLTAAFTIPALYLCVTFTNRIDPHKITNATNPPTMYFAFFLIFSTPN